MLLTLMWELLLLQTTPYKFLCVWLDMLILKYIQMYKEPRIVKAILQNKNKIEGLTFTYLKKYYKTTVIKNPDIGPQNINRLVEHTIEFRNKSIYMWLFDLCQKWYWRQWERMVFWISIVGSTEHLYRIKCWSLPHTIHKNQFQMEHRFKHESENIMASRRKQAIWEWQIFFNSTQNLVIKNKLITWTIWKVRISIH